MKRYAFIYYSNETSLGLRRRQLVAERIEQLRLSGEELANAIADRVEGDLLTFPQTTYRQVVEIERLLRDQGVAAHLAGAVVFHNETASCGWYEVLRAGEYQSSKEPFRGATANHELLEASPLSSPIALSAALGEVARHFLPSDHEFILITRSHGTDVMAITPALIEATLDRAIAGNAKPDGTLDDSTEPLPLDSDSSNLGVYDLGRYFLGAFYGIGGKGMVLGGPDEAKVGVGITKEKYLDLLEDSGNDLAMHYSLVFMDSCGSEIPRELSREVPRNIRHLYGSTQEGLRYEAPEYALLGTEIEVGGQPNGIVAAMQHLLERTPNVTRFVLGEGTERRRSL
ncbi:hypothetical protein V5E97_11990 [Singulisphaera sp. Ch08]|uniref:FIST domain-containing protein n=1 Tax=Singulisphaera sp. Ch08 TaxID=3120278 RepID=A0AAU7CMQ7_9BACT